MRHFVFAAKPLEKEQLPLPTEKGDDKATAAHDQLYETISTKNVTVQASETQNVVFKTAEVYVQPPCGNDVVPYVCMYVCVC